MTVKKFKILKALNYTGIVLVAAAMIILWSAIIADISGDGLIIAVIAACIVMAFIGCVLIIIYNAKIKDYSAWNIKDVFKNVVKYDPLPYTEIDNYAKEIESVRKNFAADTSDNKNMVSEKTIRAVKRLKSRNGNSGSLSDISALQTGKICYAYAVDCLFGSDVPRAYFKFGIIKVLYSPDPYYDKHPLALDDVLNSFADYEGTMPDGTVFNGIDLIMDPFLVNHKISTKVSGGREVYLTSVIAERRQLPTGYVANNIFPVIVATESCSPGVVVDCRYWSDDFAANFAYKKDSFRYAQYNAKRISEFAEHTCGDYAAELKNIRKNYTADKGNRPVDFNGENPFPLLNFSNVQFYYACVLDGDKHKREGEPYICIYSTDKEFLSNPMELKAIAERLKSNRDEAAKIKTVVNERAHTVRIYKLPKELTDGYNVEMTVLFADKHCLPLLNFSDNPVPVVYIAEGKEEQGFLHLADCRYWSNGFTYEYVNADVYLR